MINACEKSKQPERAMELFDLMQKCIKEGEERERMKEGPDSIEDLVGSMRHRNAVREEEKKWEPADAVQNADIASVCMKSERSKPAPGKSRNWMLGALAYLIS